MSTSTPQPISGPIPWKFTYASVTGVSHQTSGAPCQDASKCEIVSAADGSSILLAAVSDGAGSAPKAETGSRLTCASFIQTTKQFFETGGTLYGLTESFARTWLAQVRKEISAEASSLGLTPGDYACTLVAAVAGANEAVFLHVGDGAIVAARHGQPSDYHCISWPQQGEYVNSTLFVTDDDAASNLVLCYEAGVEEIALFSDGLQHLVLDYEYQLAHAPFFDSVFSWLRASQEAGPSNALESFLNSPKVNERTDDDKSLILATRRSPFTGLGS